MAVNREQRRKVADNLAALMRGEITYHQYVERGKELVAEIEQSENRDKFAEFNARVPWLVGHRSHQGISVDEKTWNQMCCRLAFLESDLVMKRTGRWPEPGLRKVLLWFVPVVAIVLGVAGWPLFGPEAILVGAWGGLGLGTWIVLFFVARRVRKKAKPMPHEFVWHPFNDEAQFEQYRNKLDRFELPEYDPAVHKVPDSSGATSADKVAHAVFMVAFYPLLLALFLIAGPGALLLALLDKPGYYRTYTAVPADDLNSTP